MYIGLVGPLPPPSGGMANQTQQLARLLRSEGLNAEVVQTNAPYRPRAIGNVRGVRALFRLLPYLGRLWQTAGRADLVHVMANSGWSWHLFAAPAIWIAWLRRTPVVVNYRGGEAEAFFRKSFRWVQPSLKRVAAVIVPSGFLADVFRRRGVDVHLVKNIVDLDRFSLNGARPRQQHPGPHLLVTRNLEPIYDIGTALRAFELIHAAFPDARLTVCGSGPELANLTAMATALDIGDAVTFTGRIDNKSVAGLYRSADIMLNPSLADNMPISILEALACGVPVVSTNVGGVPYLVTHNKTALLVPPGDHIAMAEAVNAILANPALSESLAQAGYREIHEYSWPKVRGELLAVYRSVLANTANFNPGKSNVHKQP